MSIRTIDLPFLQRAGVGFDKSLDLLMSAIQAPQTTFPPYNIVQLTENEYVIELAVAGFAAEQLQVMVEQQMLTVQGTPVQRDEDSPYLHRGISNREFVRKFPLADNIEVTSSELKNGILSIFVIRKNPNIIPVRTITINSN